MIKMFFVLLTALVLTGCATTKETVAVVQTKNILIVPPDELLTRCDVEPPPPTKEYIFATWENKEDMLIKHSTSQMKNLFKCNKMIDNLSDWKKKQIELYPVEPIKK